MEAGDTEEGPLWANSREAPKPAGRLEMRHQRAGKSPPPLGKNPGRQQDSEKEELPGVSGTTRQGHSSLTLWNKAISVSLKAQEIGEWANESETYGREDECLLDNLSELITRDQMSNRLLNRGPQPSSHPGLKGLPLRAHQCLHTTLGPLLHRPPRIRATK